MALIFASDANNAARNFAGRDGVTKLLVFPNTCQKTLHIAFDQTITRKTSACHRLPSEIHVRAAALLLSAFV
jgi:hypothetical protein